MIDAEEYKKQLFALLPRGALWESLADDSLFDALFDAEAQEFGRIDGRIDDLINEADPQTTLELLPEWEELSGLPDDCLSTPPTTISERRAALVGRLTARGGQSRQYFIDLAAALGFTITITEFQAWTTQSPSGDPIQNIDWRFAWQVNAALNTITYFNALSGANEALATWGNESLECVLSRHKPAQTTIIFSYT